MRIRHQDTGMTLNCGVRRPCAAWMSKKYFGVVFWTFVAYFFAFAKRCLNCLLCSLCHFVFGSFTCPTELEIRKPSMSIITTFKYSKALTANKNKNQIRRVGRFLAPFLYIHYKRIVKEISITDQRPRSTMMWNFATACNLQTCSEISSSELPASSASTSVELDQRLFVQKYICTVAIYVRCFT